MDLLTAEPTAHEILVNGVLMHRWAERDGTYAELLKRRSQSLNTLPNRREHRHRPNQLPAARSTRHQLSVKDWGRPQAEPPLCTAITRSAPHDLACTVS